MKELIINNVKDLVTELLYYGRKEDEDLMVGDIESAINDGIITIEEIILEFSKELSKQLVSPKR